MLEFSKKSGGFQQPVAISDSGGLEACWPLNRYLTGLIFCDMGEVTVLASFHDSDLQ